MTIRSRTRLSPLARRGTRCATVGDWHSPAAKEKGNCLPLLSQRSPSTPPQSALPPAPPQGEALRYRYSGFVPLANVFVCTTFRQSFSYFLSFPAPVSGAFFVLFPTSKNTISLCIRRDCRTSGFFATIASQSGTGTAPVEKKGSDRPCRTDTRSNRPKHLYMKN